MEFAELRRLMVTRQIAARGISDERLLAAMLSVPRHLFVPEAQQPKAYDDMALSIGSSQTISQPYMVAKMTELLELTGEEKVLEIGTGSGYQCAILAELAREVYTIERFQVLADRSREVITSLGYKNVRFFVGDGTLGLAEAAPFDRIIITAGAPRMPVTLTGQLKEGGVIVAPVGDRMAQTLIKSVRKGDKLVQEYHTSCVFVPLVGEHGWDDR